MKYTLILVMLLTGCSIRQDMDDRAARIASVEIGDSFEVMTSKIGDHHYRKRCYETKRSFTCSFIYEVYHNKYTSFRFINTDAVASIYN